MELFIIIIALTLTIWVFQIAFQLWGAAGRARRAQAEQEKAYWSAVISGYADAIRTSDEMQDPLRSSGGRCRPTVIRPPPPSPDEFRTTMRARGCTGAEDCCCHGCCPDPASMKLSVPSVPSCSL